MYIMKKIFITLMALFFAAASFAQLDRSVRPEPAKAEPIDFGKYKVYELDNGITLVVVSNDKLPRVTFRMLVDVDPVLEADKAGYVSMTGSLLRQGTTNRSKDVLDEEIDFMGASLFTGSSLVYASGLSKYSEKLMELMADVALNPAFPQEEFDKLMKQELSGIESVKDDPDALSSRVFNATVYGQNHPYGELTTESTFENISVEDCRKFYNTHWAPNKTYIAVVGDIKARSAKKLVKKYFGDWARKEVPEYNYPAPTQPTGKVVNVINRSNSSQTVLRLGNTINLKPGDPNIVKIALANQILGGGSLGRLFQNLREDKAYTYGAYSSYDDDRLIGEFSANASVRNEVTDSAITQFLEEFERLRTEPVSEEDLQAAKNNIAGSFGRSLESPQTMASFALNILRYNLPEDYYENYLNRMAALTPKDIQEAAQQYIKTDAMTITAVGKGTEIGDKLKAFGPVNYYNYKGEEVDEPSLPLPDGVTAKSVVENYIKAIGGKENLAKIKDISMTMNADISGMPPSMKASATVKRKRPNLFLNEISVTGMGTVQKQVYNGKIGKSSGMQGEKTLEGEELEQIKASGKFFVEQEYTSEDYTLKLEGMEMLGEQKAFVLKVTDPQGNSTTEYYDADSGLKLKEATTIDTEQGEISQAQIYSNYEERQGVKFPMQMKIEGPQKITMTVEELKVNSGLKLSDFK
jgi:predicted Zn-dependent peptidase